MFNYELNNNKKEYLDIFFSIQFDKDKYDKAFKKVCVENVFRYRKYDKHLVEIIKNDKIFMAKQSFLNDPYDCFLNYNGDYDELFLHLCNGDVDFDLNTTNREMLEKELYKPLKENINNLKHRVGIACFSESNNNQTMWSHYANEHTGVCIKYSVYDIYSLLCKEDNKFCFAPIHYDNEATNYTVNDFQSGQINKYIYKKSLDWRNECEWRLHRSLTKNADEKGESFEFIEPAAIYLGVNILPENQDEITKIARERGIKLYKMNLSSEELKLIPQEL